MEKTPAFMAYFDCKRLLVLETLQDSLVLFVFLENYHSMPFYTKISWALDEFLEGLLGFLFFFRLATIVSRSCMDFLILC